MCCTKDTFPGISCYFATVRKIRQIEKINNRKEITNKHWTLKLQVE